MPRIGPPSSVMRCQHTRIAWRRWWPPRKRKRRSTGYSRAKRTRYAARWRKRSRTLATDDHPILDVPGWIGRVAAATRYFRVAVGRRERGPHRFRIGGTGPVADQAIPAGTDERPQPEPSVQEGGVYVRCPDAQNQRDNYLP